jgi:cytochrome c biogenesis protein CcmG/thiol:disulfide interchange protein DsbE
MWRYVLPALVFVAIVSFLALGLGRDPTRVPSPLIGKPAPAFSVAQLDDPTKHLSNADLMGHVSVVNVWATWCVSCRDEHLLLLELARSGGVPIYGLDYKDERGAAIEWLSRLGNPYVANAFDGDGRVAIDWGVYGTPETFVLDKRAVIRYKHIGPLTPEFVNSDLLPLLAKLKAEDG